MVIRSGRVVAPPDSRHAKLNVIPQPDNLSMKAYEFPAKLNAVGSLDIPEAILKNLSTEQEMRVIVLVTEQADDPEPKADELEFSSDRFRQSWQQAMTGQTLPLSQLWEGVDVD
jgi:hypothetical protein